MIKANVIFAHVPKGIVVPHKIVDELWKTYEDKFPRSPLCEAETVTLLKNLGLLELDGEEPQG